MKYLITGGAGFIGSNYLHYVVNKYKDDYFICIDKLTYAGNYENIKSLEKMNNFKFIRGDITKKKQVNDLFKKEKIDYCINFAAESHVDNSIKNPCIFEKTNIKGTLVLLNACNKYGIKKFHQISTDEVYGDLPLDLPDLKFSEESMLRPSSPYSASKASADLLVMAYYRTYGLPVSISRCSNNYGPYQFYEKLIPLVISKALNNEKIPIYGDGKNIRDWIHVMDHCVGIDLIVRKGEVGEIYNIGGNSEISNIELVKLILKIMNKPFSLIEYVSDRPGHDLRYSVDFSKLQNKLGWSLKYNLKNGIIDTIDWYLNNKDWFKKDK